MSVALVINTITDGNYWSEKTEKYDFLEILIQKIKKILPLDDTYILASRETRKIGGERFKSFKIISVDKKNEKTVLQRLYQELKSYQDLIHVFVDTPLLDIDVTKKLLQLHQEEVAEYTYGEGFPLGIAPEIIKVAILPRLISLVEKDEKPFMRSSLFETLSRDINSFDVETYFASHDLKLRRIELSTSLKRNLILVKKVVEELGPSPSYNQFVDLIEEKPSILRTIPSFIEIEITSEINTECIYSPLPHINRKQGSMGFEQFKLIFNSIAEFCHNFYLAFSPPGEPLLNREFRHILEHSLSYPGAEIIIETDGVLCNPDFSDYLKELNVQNVHIIFDLDAVKDETYRKIKGENARLDLVERNLRYLISREVKNVYVQMVRMNVNEQEMLRFFDIWEKEGAKVIIQKYSNFLGLLPEYARYDLSPLERMPCWHLLRDLVVFNTGDVPRCKQDQRLEFPLGNLLHEEIEKVWKRGECHYLSHCRKEYDDRCKICSEYYTFNF